MKLALNKESADLLYYLADKLPESVNKITDDTDTLLNVYRSVEGDLGVHKEQFELMLLHAKKATLLALDSISQIQIVLNTTADYIMEYVNSDNQPNSSEPQKTIWTKR